MPNDIDYAVRTRLQRQELLYRRDKQFHFVLTEAALRYRRCSLEAQIAQLDRLMSLSALPNVRLGIIGFETPYAVGPWHAFWLRDKDRVTIETFSAELNLAQPQEAELYARVFDGLAAVASYGRAARAIITRVIDDLAPEAPDEEWRVISACWISFDNGKKFEETFTRIGPIWPYARKKYPS